MLLIFEVLFARTLHKKRILYVDSYHLNYGNSTIMIESFENKLKANALNYELKIIRMDSKRQKKVAYLKNVALDIKSYISQYKPDLVIVAEDNASKYLVVPHYKNSTVPFIFIGVNDSIVEYGYPFNNVTGQIEVNFVKPMVKLLEKHSRGNRIGYLNDQTFTSQKTLLDLEKKFNRKVYKKLINSLDEWKKEFLNMQKKVDILLLGTNRFVNKDDKALMDFVKTNTSIITAGWDKPIASMVLLVFAKDPYEFGEWAGEKAIEVLNGKAIKKIEITKNKKAKIYINKTIMKKLHIFFSYKIIENAQMVK